MSDSPILFTWQELLTITEGSWLVPPAGEEAGGVQAVSMDSRAIAAGELFLAYRGETHDSHDYLSQALDHQAAALIVDRRPSHALLDRCLATAVPCLQVSDTLAAYQALGHAHRRRFDKLRVIAITGSSGKTSTKEMVAAIARAAVGVDAVLATQGNTNNLIGVPRNLLQLRLHHRIAVLELGTSLPGEIAILTRLVQPDIAILTSIGPVHLEGLGSIEGVRREKAAIFEPLALNDGWAILPRELAQEPILADLLPAGRTITVGSRPDADLRVTYVSGDLEGSRFTASLGDQPPVEVSWPLHGAHQAANGGLALAAGLRLGVDLPAAAAALAKLLLPGMRMAITERDGVHWINDAYNANADSMRALIDWLALAVKPDQPLILCLGDMLELGEQVQDFHREIISYARRRLPAGTIVAIGPEMARAAGELGGCIVFEQVPDARDWLHSQLPTSGVVAIKASRGMRLERLLPA